MSPAQPLPAAPPQLPGPVPGRAAPVRVGAHRTPGRAACSSPASCSRVLPHSSGSPPASRSRVVGVSTPRQPRPDRGGRLRALPPDRPRQAAPPLARPPQADPLLRLHRRRPRAADRVVLRRLRPRAVPQRRVVPRHERLQQRQQRGRLPRAHDRHRDPARPGPARRGADPRAARVGARLELPGRVDRARADRAGAVRRQPQRPRPSGRAAWPRRGQRDLPVAASCRPAPYPRAVSRRISAGPWEHVATPGVLPVVGELQRLWRRHRRPVERARPPRRSEVDSRAARRRPPGHRRGPATPSSSTFRRTTVRRAHPRRDERQDRCGDARRRAIV